MALKIKLSEHRKAFRVGSMRVETLSADADGRDIELTIDEPIDEKQLHDTEQWYLKAGAEKVLVVRQLLK